MGSSWQRVHALIRKEFLAVLKDRKARFVLIVPPFIQLLVFGYAASFDLKEVPYALYNEDRGAVSRGLAAAFRGSPHFQQVAQLSRAGEIAPLIDARGALLVVHIGPQFSRDLLSGRPARVQIIIDGRNSNTALIALDYARTIISQFNDEWREKNGLPGPPAALSPRMSRLMKRGSAGSKRMTFRAMVSVKRIQRSAQKNRSPASSPEATAWSCEREVMTVKSSVPGLFWSGMKPSLHAPTRVRSWPCATATSPWKACSFIRRACSRRKVRC